MLTPLEPPSSASSSGPREVERSLQTTSQLPEALPVTPPPESYPEQHRDTVGSSRVTSVFKQWFQPRLKKTNRNQASQLPDPLSTKSGQPINPFNSLSQPIANIELKEPSRMAAGQRERVSISFLGRQKMCGMSDGASQRTVAKPVIWVRCSVCSLGPLVMLRDSVREIPKLLK